MPVVAAALAGGGTDGHGQTENVAGQHRPPTASSSPNPKGDREAQQTKKRAKPSMTFPGNTPMQEAAFEETMSDGQKTPRPASPRPSVWGSSAGAARRLFGDSSHTGTWYIADSDSEGIAEAMREDGKEADFEGTVDPKCPSIEYTLAEERMFCREWRSALVVMVLGRSLSYTLIAKKLNGIWAKAGPIQVTSAKNGYFLVRFTKGVDYERAITGGPWMVGDNYLTVHPWTQDFNPYNHEISSTLVWARLLDIPIHYFHQVAVMKIGKPIRVDQATSTGARSDYARVCVQVDITKPLLSQFMIHGIKYFIQYEGLEKICLQCGSYFERSSCSCLVQKDEMESESVSPQEPEIVKEPEKLYGEWMIAKRRPRARKESL
ncbi:unnamed protein product [Linum trigynum]|uniref:DUF4283 domain-containing protein n=1 Tax=Linum trigynum TaxID=586398 RepID=A0AAV2E0P5_9ROSI